MKKDVSNICVPIMQTRWGGCFHVWRRLVVQRTPSPSSAPPQMLYMIIRRLSEGEANQRKEETERGRRRAKETRRRKPRGKMTRRGGRTPWELFCLPTKSMTTNNMTSDSSELTANRNVSLGQQGQHSWIRHRHYITSGWRLEILRVLHPG